MGKKVKSKFSNLSPLPTRSIVNFQRFILKKKHSHASSQNKTKTYLHFMSLSNRLKNSKQWENSREFQLHLLLSNSHSFINSGKIPGTKESQIDDYIIGWFNQIIHSLRSLYYYHESTFQCGKVQCTKGRRPDHYLKNKQANKRWSCWCCCCYCWTFAIL